MNRLIAEIHLTSADNIVDLDQSARVLEFKLVQGVPTLFALMNPKGVQVPRRFIIVPSTSLFSEGIESQCAYCGMITRASGGAILCFEAIRVFEGYLQTNFIRAIEV